MTRTEVVTIHEALTRAREHIDGQIDVLDGDYGEPRPNAAMSLAQMLDEALSIVGRAI